PSPVSSRTRLGPTAVAFETEVCVLPAGTSLAVRLSKDRLTAPASVKGEPGRFGPIHRTARSMGTPPPPTAAEGATEGAGDTTTLALSWEPTTRAPAAMSAATTSKARSGRSRRPKGDGRWATVSTGIHLSRKVHCGR